MITARFIGLAVAIGLAIVALPIVSHAAKSAKKPVKAPKTDPNETFIRQAYDYQLAGMEALNVNQAYSYTTNDYSEIDKTGQTATKSEAVARLYQAFQEAATYKAVMHVTQKIERLDISQTTAVAIVSAHVWLQVPDSDPSQPPQKVEVSGGKGRDTWVRMPHGWAMQKSEWLSDTE